MQLSDLLAAVGIKPKDLDQARAALEPAKATLESVNQLFTNAGLNLDQMLAGGPDALKSHIDSLAVNDEELATALLEVERLEKESASYVEKAQNYAAAFDAVGFKFDEKTDIKTAFGEHVKKAAAVELAKAGHPPVPVISADSISTKTDAEIFAEWRAFPSESSERIQFFQKHELAIRRALNLKN